MKSDITLHINHASLLFADNATYLGAMFIVDNTRRVICVLLDSVLNASSVHPVIQSNNNGIRLTTGTSQISGPENFIYLHEQRLFLSGDTLYSNRGNFLHA
jgi:hypothetical protein